MEPSELIPANLPPMLQSSLSEVLWFSFRNGNQLEIDRVQAEFEKAKSAGVSSVKLGIACDELNTDEGVKWYDWLLTTFGEYFEIELCFDNFSKNPKRSSSTRHSLLEILEHFIFKHGKYFTLIELWRNPAASSTSHSSDNIFAEDVVFAASWAKQWGKKVGLGRIRAMDVEWLTKLSSTMFFKKIDFIELDLTVRDWFNISHPQPLQADPNTGSEEGRVKNAKGLSVKVMKPHQSIARQIEDIPQIPFFPVTTKYHFA